MVSWILAAGLLHATQTAPLPLPPRPLGLNVETHRRIDGIEAALGQGDFEAADELRRRTLPDEITVAALLDEVPAERRDEFSAAIDRALGRWREQGGFSVRRVTPDAGRDLLVRFLDEITGDDGRVKGIRIVRREPEDPTEIVFVSLVRGERRIATRPNEVANEVLYAVGRRLGLAENPITGAALGRTDLPTGTEFVLDPAERLAAEQWRALRDALKAAIEGKRPVHGSRAGLVTDPAEINLGQVRQGEVVPITLSVENRGDGPLTLRAIPDCGCMRVEPVAEVGPGRSGRIRVWLDTSTFGAPIRKRVLLLSNDPGRPMLTLPIVADVQPDAILYRTKGDVWVVDEAPFVTDVLLAFHPQNDALPVAASLEGLPGTARLIPERFIARDPFSGASFGEVDGYRVRIRLEGDLPPGRTPLTLWVTTSTPGENELSYNLTVQRGIVALPSEAFVGELGDRPVDTRVVLSRPGRPFRILGIQSSVPFLIAEVGPPAVNGDQTLRIRSTGEVPLGDLRAKLVLTTDDPRQPKLTVTVRGSRG